MAKTPVVMKIADYKDREVQMVTYEFDQETDREGQMTGIPRGGKIQVRVKALNDGTPELMAWMCDRFLKKDGSIQFLETKTLKVMKEIKFRVLVSRNSIEPSFFRKRSHIQAISSGVPSFKAFTRTRILPPRGIPTICPSRSVS